MNLAELRRLEAEADNVKRYAPSIGRTLSGMTERPEGDYVRYADYLAMRNALPELLKALEWQPIETAPRVPGNQILGYCPNKGTRETSFASSNGTPSEDKTDGWWQWHEPANNWVQSWQPTHWRPLPLPPHGGVDAG